MLLELPDHQVTQQQLLESGIWQEAMRKASLCIPMMQALIIMPEISQAL